MAIRLRGYEPQRSFYISAEAIARIRTWPYSLQMEIFNEARSTLHKRADQRLSSRYLHSPNSFVKVSEGYATDSTSDLRIFTIVRKAQGQDSPVFHGRELPEDSLESLMYTTYRFSDPKRDNIRVENRKIRPDGTPGELVSRHIISPREKSVSEVNSLDSWQPTSLATTSSLEPLPSRKSWERIKELRTTFQELSDNAVERDGTSLDYDGKKNGKVSFSPILTYGGLLGNEPQTRRVLRQGLAGKLGFREEVENPYILLSTHGSIETEGCGVKSLELKRERVIAKEFQEVAELKPDVSEAHFKQRTDADGSKIYEVRVNGSTERLIEEKNGTISYFTSGPQEQDLLNHDLPSFLHKAREPDRGDGTKALAYLEHHQRISKIPRHEQPRAWAQLALLDRIDPTYAIKSIQGLPLTRGQGLALRLGEHAAEQQREGAKSRSIIQKATLTVFHGLSSQELSLNSIAKTTRAIIKASNEEKGPNKRLFLEQGLARLYTIVLSDAALDTKMAVPRMPKSLEQDPHFLSGLIGLGDIKD